jgi:catechol-2,3-dioxygenase
MAKIRKKKSLEEKIREDYGSFYDEVIGLSIADLEKRLSTYAKENEKVNVAMEQDEELKKAKETAKEMAAPYNDTKKALRLKNKFIVQLIADKGGEV